MTLQPGSRLGPYQVTGKLGEGGMGVVWRARDARLGRDVALKVLPAEVAADPERRARFEREANVLAQLNHPNVAGIHGLEADGESLALVMELVEGPTLDQRLEHGPLPPEEALEIARQVAAALEEAHERGIVHRDLKPENVKAPVEGTVKVLDFGLAKAIDPAADTPAAAATSSPTSMNSPTLTAAGTRLGVILGTASYMAPEQARGIPIDRRADIWSFGVVLFEMLTGRRLFEGELVTDVLASVLRQEVDFGALPVNTPPAIRRLLRRCLQRRPKERLRDIGDARLVIEEVLRGEAQEPSAGAAPEHPAPPPRWIGPAIAVTALIVGTVAGWLARPAPDQAPVAPETRLALALPAGVSIAAGEQPALALSPDGRRQVLVVRNGEGRPRLLLRDLSVLEPWILSGTEDAEAPFFSPDGRWVAFFAHGALHKIPVDGGLPQQLAEVRQNPRGGSWSADGYLYFAPGTAAPILRVSEDGGPAKEVVPLDASRDERTHRWPSALPDGRAVLFAADTFESPEEYDDARIDAVRPATGERVPLIEGASQARFLPPDRLVFARGGSLYTVGFDPEALELRGFPVLALQDVARFAASGAVHFDLSREGTVAWGPGALLHADRVVERYSPELDPMPVFLEPGPYSQLAVSPDGRRLALVQSGPGGQDLWIADLERETQTRRTFGVQVADPVWTPDGARIAVGLIRNGASSRDVYWLTPSGGEEPQPLLEAQGQVYPSAFSKDGSQLVYERSDASSPPQLWVADLSAGGPGRPWGNTAAGFQGDLSPDGRWLAHTLGLDASGIQVRPFPGGEARWQAAPRGFEPHWAPDGRSLYFRLDGSLWRTAVELGEDVAIGQPVELLDGLASNGPDATTFDVGPDGSLWLVRQPQIEEGESQVFVIQAWNPP